MSKRTWRSGSEAANPLTCPRGFSGVLVMCDISREKQAGREVTDLLTDYIRQLYPEVFDVTTAPTPEAADAHTSASAGADAGADTGADTRAGAGEGEPAPATASSEAAVGNSVPSEAPTSVVQRERTLEDELEAELAELRGAVASRPAAKRSRLEGDAATPSDGTTAKAAAPRHCRWQEVTRAVCMVWFPDTRVDMVRVVSAVFEDILREHRCPTRHVSRLIPLHRIVRSQEDELTALATQCVAEHFPAQPPDTWAIEYSSRNNSSLRRDAVYGIVRGRVPLGHVVAKKGANTVLVVEIVQSFAGMAVVRGGNFHRYHKFNVRVASEKEEERQARLVLAARAAAKGAAASTTEGESSATDAGASPAARVEAAACAAPSASAPGGDDDDSRARVAGAEEVAPTLPPAVTHGDAPIATSAASATPAAASTPVPTVQHEDGAEGGRFFIPLPGAGGEAVIEYRLQQAMGEPWRVVDVWHTETPPAARGQGLAARLMQAVCEWAEAKAWPLRATCSYAAQYVATGKPGSAWVTANAHRLPASQ